MRISTTIKRGLKRTPLLRLVRMGQLWGRYARWIREGKEGPIPHLIKRRVIRGFAKRFRLPVFIETGTFLGDMVAAMSTTAKKVYSIELGEELHRAAQARFAGQPHVEILHGDSGKLLGEVLARVGRPALLWLDGHYSMGPTARAELETPIVEELTHVANHPLKREHVILIDDAYLFTGTGDYPSLDFLRHWAEEQGYDTFEIQSDIVCIYNAAR